MRKTRKPKGTCYVDPIIQKTKREGYLKAGRVAVRVPIRTKRKVGKNRGYKKTV